MENLTVTLIHPSRGRPEKAYNNYKRWLSKAGKNAWFYYVLSLDSNDPEKENYYQQYLPHNKFDCWTGTIIENNNSCVVEATNRAAEVAKGDILIYMSDDFDAPDNWYHLVVKEFEGESGPLLVKVDDCLQKFEVTVLTIPIMNRAMYERLGYFFHPAYKSMHVDVDLYWTARKLGIKNAKHLKFPHEHPANGKAKDDETYRRSAANWDQGLAVLNERKKEGFPI